MRRATLEDVESLVALMSEFYAESDYRLDPRRAAEAFRSLIADGRLGHAWLLESGREAVGYLVVTLGFSMEYGGPDAFVDDLYIRPQYRGLGIGTQALEEARTFCVASGVRAVHIEVGHDNAAAKALYRKVGFEDTKRQLLTLRLADAL